MDGELIRRKQESDTAELQVLHALDEYYASEKKFNQAKTEVYIKNACYIDAMKKFSDARQRYLRYRIPE